MERDRYSRPRSPDRRYQSRDSDTYVPSSRSVPRPRSRSPPYAGRGGRSPPPPARESRDSRDHYRRPSPRHYDSHSTRDARPRSPPPPPPPPPRRDYSPDPRYDDGPRSRRERSPPALKRGRVLSPAPGTRSPPPAKRERYASPAREYTRQKSPPRSSHRPRSRSPRRDDRSEPYPAKSWRRQSPVPHTSVARSGAGHGAGAGSGRDSVASSRRSSPRPYARASEAYAGDDLRGPHGDFRSPRPRSPPRRDGASRGRSPHHAEESYGGSRNRTGAEDHSTHGRSHLSSSSSATATPADYRDRAPPTGPAAGVQRDTNTLPPSGPAATTTSSSNNRPSVANAPSGPGLSSRGSYRGRGAPTPSREYSLRDPSAPPTAPRGRGGAGAGAGSGGWGGPPSHGRGRAYPPSGPAESAYDARGSARRDNFHGAGGGGGGRGGGSSTSLTTPRTQRFNTALSDLPKVKEGGEKLPSLYDTSKADKLEEEAARLRKLIDDKETKKREGLREWERLERESSNSALRTELAEEHLKSMNGEDALTTAAF